MPFMAVFEFKYTFEIGIETFLQLQGQWRSEQVYCQITYLLIFNN